jgi:hypothetical protein
MAVLTSPFCVRVSSVLATHLPRRRQSRQFASLDIRVAPDRDWDNPRTSVKSLLAADTELLRDAAAAVCRRALVTPAGACGGKGA